MKKISPTLFRDVDLLEIAYQISRHVHSMITSDVYNFDEPWSDWPSYFVFGPNCWYHQTQWGLVLEEVPMVNLRQSTHRMESGNLPADLDVEIGQVSKNDSRKISDWSCCNRGLNISMDIPDPLGRSPNGMGNRYLTRSTRRKLITIP